MNSNTGKCDLVSERNDIVNQDVEYFEAQILSIESPFQREAFLPTP